MASDEASYARRMPFCISLEDRDAVGTKGGGGHERAEGRKRQRAVMATDSDWETVRERADAAGMDVSRFVVERLTAPVAVPESRWRRCEGACRGGGADREGGAGALRGREAARGRQRGGGDLGGSGAPCRGSRVDAEEALGMTAERGERNAAQVAPAHHLLLGGGPGADRKARPGSGDELLALHDRLRAAWWG